MSRVVYFIKPIGMDGPVKVGCSKNADLRRANLAAWCPINLELLATTPGDIELEGRIHHYLIDDHERQEWFRHSRRLRALIASVKDGTFNPDDLPVNVGPIRHVAAARDRDTALVLEYRALHTRWSRQFIRARPLTGVIGHYHISPSVFATMREPRQRETLEMIRADVDRIEFALAAAA